MHFVVIIMVIISYVAYWKKRRKGVKECVKMTKGVMNRKRLKTSR